MAASRFKITSDSLALQISHDDIPIQVREEIDGVPIRMEFLYNDQGDFYTVVFRDEQETVIGTAKLTYGNNILERLAPRLGLTTKIIPIDVGRESKDERSDNPRVSKDNFGKSVFLVLFSGVAAPAVGGVEP